MVNGAFVKIFLGFWDSFEWMFSDWLLLLLFPQLFNHVAVVLFYILNVMGLVKNYRMNEKFEFDQLDLNYNLKLLFHYVWVDLTLMSRSIE